jgi:predicted N-acetyltransferase YhbS
MESKEREAAFRDLCKGLVLKSKSFTTELDHEIVGHLLMSKAEVIDGERKQEIIVLAPVAVKPEYQKQGIGKQLMAEELKRCKEYGFYIVMLIGPYILS